MTVSIERIEDLVGRVSRDVSELVEYADNGNDFWLVKSHREELMASAQKLGSLVMSLTQ